MPVPAWTSRCSPASMASVDRLRHLDLAAALLAAERLDRGPQHLADAAHPAASSEEGLGHPRTLAPPPTPPRSGKFSAPRWQVPPGVPATSRRKLLPLRGSGGVRRRCAAATLSPKARWPAGVQVERRPRGRESIQPEVRTYAAPYCSAGSARSASTRGTGGRAGRGARGADDDARGALAAWPHAAGRSPPGWRRRAGRGR